MFTYCPGSCAAESPFLSLLVHASQRGREPLEAHEHVIQRAIYALQLTEKYHSLVSGFVFSEAGSLPYSPALDMLLQSFSSRGMIHRGAPRREQIHIRPAAISWYDSHISEEVDARIDEAALEFRSLLQKK